MQDGHQQKEGNGAQNDLIQLILPPVTPPKTEVEAKIEEEKKPAAKREFWRRMPDCVRGAVERDISNDKKWGRNNSMFEKKGIFIPVCVGYENRFLIR